MKKYLILTAVMFCGLKLLAQSSNSLTLKDLAVPSSPAFSITDITPTLIQNPNTPKSLILGVAQSSSQTSNNFPDNYSAEFTPYWWVKQKGRNVFSFLGLNTKDTSKNVFAGLKFTSVSVAFVNKDLIPDEATTTQKVFAIGIHSTIIKIHKPGWASKMKKSLADWHQAALNDIAAVQDYAARHDGEEPPNAPNTSDALLPDIRDMINEKPAVVWDVAGAYSAYGITDQDVKTGRIGAWTSLSTYITLDGKDAKVKTNYFTLSASCRYLADNYEKNDAGVIGRVNNWDIGGTAGFQLNQVNIGVESLYRYANGIANTQNRTVGVINVKVADNIYVSGTFGKDFSGPNKLISLFGLNWGIGKEKVDRPQ
jgi:hypothetical protein